MPYLLSLRLLPDSLELLLLEGVLVLRVAEPLLLSLLLPTEVPLLLLLLRSDERVVAAGRLSLLEGLEL